MILPYDKLNDVRRILNTEAAYTSPNGEKKYDRKKVEDIILDYLIFCYVTGVDSANEMLFTSLVPDAEEMEETINRKIAGKDFAERVRDYAEGGGTEGADEYRSTEEELLRVADTDGNRVFNEGALNTAKKGGAAYKTWTTAEDLKVRDTHGYLEGVTVGIDDVFVTYDGDSARHPGDFTDAANNVNCRCHLVFS